jgi:hypothetical protein
MLFKLQCCTPVPASTGTGLVGVHNLIPLPVPMLTRCLYPRGFPYPCHSLELCVWNWVSPNTSDNILLTYKQSLVPRRPYRTTA